MQSMSIHINSDLSNVLWLKLFNICLPGILDKDAVHKDIFDNHMWFVIKNSLTEYSYPKKIRLTEFTQTFCDNKVMSVIKYYLTEYLTSNGSWKNVKCTIKLHYFNKIIVTGKLMIRVLIFQLAKKASKKKYNQGFWVNSACQIYQG